MAAVIEIKLDDPGGDRSESSAPVSGSSAAGGGGGGGGGGPPAGGGARAQARRMGQAAALMARSKKMQADAARAQARRMGQAAALMARMQRKAASDTAARARLAERARKKQEALNARNQRAVEQARKVTEREAARQKREQERRDRQAEAKRARDLQKQNRAESAREQKKLAEETRAANARSAQILTAAGGAAAAIIRGGGPGAVIGGALGTAVGARFGGPAGAAVGGAVGEKVGGFVDNPAKPAGDFAERVAAGDAIGAFNKSLIGYAIPPLRLFGAVLETTNQVVGAFAARARELSGFQGNLAAATATQDVTRTMTDIREAQLLGDKFAKFTAAQTRFEETLKAGLLPLKEQILDYLPRIMDTMLAVMITGAKVADKLNPFGDMFDKMVKEAEKMRKALEGPGVAGVPLINAWINAAAGMALVEGAPGPAGVPVAGPPFPGAGLPPGGP